MTDTSSREQSNDHVHYIIKQTMTSDLHLFFSGEIAHYTALYAPKPAKTAKKTNHIHEDWMSQYSICYWKKFKPLSAIQ